MIIIPTKDGKQYAVQFVRVRELEWSAPAADGTVSLTVRQFGTTTTRTVTLTPEQRALVERRLDRLTLLHADQPQVEVV